MHQSAALAFTKFRPNVISGNDFTAFSSEYYALYLVLKLLVIYIPGGMEG